MNMKRNILAPITSIILILFANFSFSQIVTKLNRDTSHMKSKLLLMIIFCAIASTQLIAQTQTYIDNFGVQNYGNNDGTNSFLNNWSETDDDNNAAAGYIFINNGRLNFSYIYTERIQRSLSIPAGSEATL